MHRVVWEFDATIGGFVDQTAQHQSLRVGMQAFHIAPDTPRQPAHSHRPGTGSALIKPQRLGLSVRSKFARESNEYRQVASALPRNAAFICFLMLSTLDTSIVSIFSFISILQLGNIGPEIRYQLFECGEGIEHLAVAEVFVVALANLPSIPHGRSLRSDG